MNLKLSRKIFFSGYRLHAERKIHESALFYENGLFFYFKEIKKQ